MDRLPNLTSCILLAVLLSACAAPVDTTELDHPLAGGGETRFVLSPSSGEIRIRDLVAIAKVLRRYRDLEAAEKALVKLAVRRHFNGLVAMEVRKLEQANLAERRQISFIPDAKARQKAGEALSAKLLAEASHRVSARLGGLLAVPLKTSSNQSVVAFARVVSDDIRVADAAYELNVPLSKVGPDTKVAMADAPADRALQDISSGAKIAQVVADSSVSVK